MADKFVRRLADMTDEVVIKHFNARHASIGGLATTLENMSPAVVSSLRRYHERVHAAGIEAAGIEQSATAVNHEHEV